MCWFAPQRKHVVQQMPVRYARPPTFVFLHSFINCAVVLLSCFFRFHCFSPKTSASHFAPLRSVLSVDQPFVIVTERTVEIIEVNMGENSYHLFLIHHLFQRYQHHSRLRYNVCCLLQSMFRVIIIVTTSCSFLQEQIPPCLGPKEGPVCGELLK